MSLTPRRSTARDSLFDWDEIAGLFCRDAVLKGSLDQYTTSNRVEKGSATVEAAFLREIERWREMLARNLALRNPELTQHQLNAAVQDTIDRILFLRLCEDRGMERHGQLRALQDGPAVYGRLRELYRKAGERSTCGLFHFDKEKGRAEPPDEVTPRLSIDDEVLRHILRALYYPEGPYEFSVLPVEILGQVHEQFLGKVIRLTAGHQARVEARPEVKKAGGVYYTPAAIVDYVVQHTVGKLLEGKTVKQAAGLRILDPACGSGSFLLGTYRCLLDWHRDRYLADGPEKHPRELFPGCGGWHLTPAEKTRILINNLYGVDIDPQAVAITRRSLLLKVLEGESRKTLPGFPERALPDLTSNIQCGNALIGPDFHDGRQMTQFEEERHRLNVFDWHAAFPWLREAGGFDAVIGNPPWGQKAVAGEEAVKRYTRERYPSTRGIYDLFRPFVEQGIRLLAPKGMFGMVLPDIVLLKDYQETRRYLLEQLALEAIDWWGTAFASAVIDVATLLGTKRPAPLDHRVRATVHDREAPLRQEIPQADFWANPRLVFNLYLTPQKRRLIQELREYPRLGDSFEVHEGIHSGNLRKELFVASRLDASCRELYFGRGEIQPYHLQGAGRYIRLAALPKVKTRGRYANLGKPEWHERQKLLVRRTGDRVLAAVDHEGRYASNNFFLVFPRQPGALDLDGLCALLNSRLMTWYFRTIEPRQGRAFAELKIKHLSAFPLPPRIQEPEDGHALNKLGRERAELAARRARAPTPHQVAALQRRMDCLDETINALTCALFKLPAEEEVDTSQERGDSRE